MDEKSITPAGDSSTQGLERAARILLSLTVAGIMLYWGAVFSGSVAIEELAPGYTSWFMSFPLADFWIASAALASLVLTRCNRRLSAVFLAASGSALIFLGLNALAYGYWTGLLFTLSAGEIVEIAIKAYCLTVGALFLVASYRREANTRCLRAHS